MKIIYSSLIGYVFGCLNGSYFCGKIKGIDFKKVGTKNAGASNVAYSLGVSYAVIVAFIDIGKSIAAYYLCMMLFGDTFYGQLAGAACIIGHNHPFYMGFNGGKGFASFIGLVFAYNYKMTLLLLPFYLISIFTTKHMTIGTFVIMIVSIIIPWINNDWKFAIIMTIVFVDVMLRHSQNIKNLMTGNEPIIQDVKKICLVIIGVYLVLMGAFMIFNHFSLF